MEVLQNAEPNLYAGNAIWLPVFDELGYCTNARSTVAILATESYLRPPFVRRTEQIAAEIVHALTGAWPDWSYGPAQIKPSTVERIASLTDERLGELGAKASIDRMGENVVEALQAPCDAAGLIDLTLFVAAKVGDGPKEHAFRHLGGTPVPTLPGVIEYTDMIATVVDVLAIAEDTSRFLTSLQNAGDDAGWEEEPGPTGDIVWPATGWNEPEPRICLTEVEGDYRFDRWFAAWPEGTERPPLTDGILVAAYPSEAFWQDGQLVGWQETAAFLHKHATAARASDVPAENLAIAPAKAFPRAEELAGEAGCMAIVLQDGP